MASIVYRASVPSSFEACVALVFSQDLSYSSVPTQTFSPDGFVKMVLIEKQMKKVEQDLQLHVLSEIINQASAIEIQFRARNRWLLYNFSIAKRT